MLRITLIIPILVILTGCASPAARFCKTSQAITAAEDADDIPKIATLANTVKDSDLEPSSLSSYSDETLNTLYSNLDKIAFYMPDNEQYPLRMEKAFDEKVRRGKYGQEDIENMFTAFHEARLFGKAAEVRLRFSTAGLTELPAIESGNIPANTPWQVYDISTDGKTLTLKALPLNTGAHIITVSAVGCSNQENAIKDISDDAELGSLFYSNAVFVTRRFDPDGMLQLRQAVKPAPTYIMHKSADFPGVWAETSPGFYFIKNGKVVYEFWGWNHDNPAAALKLIRDGMKTIGLLPPDQTADSEKTNHN